MASCTASDLFYFILIVYGIFFYSYISNAHAIIISECCCCCCCWLLFCGGVCINANKSTLWLSWLGRLNIFYSLNSHWYSIKKNTRMLLNSNVFFLFFDKKTIVCMYGLNGNFSLFHNFPPECLTQWMFYLFWPARNQRQFKSIEYMNFASYILLQGCNSLPFYV